MIIGILNNKVYIGDLIQQKRKRISFKNHKFVKTKEDELIITKSNHMQKKERGVLKNGKRFYKSRL